MTTYYKQAEIKASMKKLVDSYLNRCLEDGNLCEDLIDLVKHNFLAKYVCYNKNSKTIEIGIEDNTKEDDFYPEIQVYKFPLNKNRKWIERSFKDSMNDLMFYGKLLNRNNMNKEAEVVLIA
ncbi:MAG TPA: hypothetical protein VLN46_06365 [Gillisia sp.]|nr:hypothetical protein [Gillisia sp.]